MREDWECGRDFCAYFGPIYVRHLLKIKRMKKRKKPPVRRDSSRGKGGRAVFCSKSRRASRRAMVFSAHALSFFHRARFSKDILGKTKNAVFRHNVFIFLCNLELEVDP